MARFNVGATRQQPLLLIGAGHAHVVTMRRWAQAGWRAPAGSMLVSTEPYAWYSGMMPGLMAGRFEERDCRIDMRPLCGACGVELTIGSVCSLSAERREARLEDGRTLSGGIVSLNVGSAPPLPHRHDASIALVPAKPFPLVIGAWKQWQTGRPGRVTVLGGGAAAFELAMALNASLPDTSLTLISGSELLSGHSDVTRKRARSLLARYDIRLIEGRHVTRVVGDELFDSDDVIDRTDALTVATGAGAHPWPCQSGLACDEHGFVRIDSTLRSLSHPDIFATGDCATLPRTPHAGVYAVRQGEVLADNLIAAVSASNPKRYHPQPRALALLSTGDGKALLSYGPVGVHGRLPGLWKDHLDTAFVRPKS